jgi:hypothetical protein
VQVVTSVINARDLPTLAFCNKSLHRSGQEVLV